MEQGGLMGDANRVKLEMEGNGDGGRKKMLLRLFMACMVSGGIQYGWALQLSLLSPYSQTLGIPHQYTSLTWICGPIAGFVRPMRTQEALHILVGCFIICISVMLIGFSADIGRRLGDSSEHCSTYTGPRWAAATVYVVGFWFLDFANNTVQGPARAMMADLSATGNHGPKVVQAIFSVWMAIGSILGYTAGANGKWHQSFPWLKTAACCDACANLKGAFLTAVLIIIITMTVTTLLADEKHHVVEASSAHGCISVFADLFKTLKNMPPSMFKVLAVTFVTWLSWFPFFQYDTDWMGREIYHGVPRGPAGKADLYNAGVREGAIGLLLCSVALGVTSFLIPNLCRKLTSKVVWSVSNLMVFLIMTAMVVVGIISTKGYNPSLAASLTGPDPKLRAIAVTLFVLIGIPQAVLFSVPWAVASEVAAEEDGGQGLTIGVLNIAIVLPQLIIALTAGPIDKAFNKVNAPAFGIGAAFAFICSILALILLPKTRGLSNAAVMAGGH